LERPFQEVLSTGKPDFGFCLGWANESWKGFAHGLKNRNVLLEQTYPGDEDIDNHFYALLPAFTDKRYIRVGNRPLFLVYKPFELPDAVRFIDRWQNLAIKNGLEGIHFVGQCQNHTMSQKVLDIGFDAVNVVRLSDFFHVKRLKPYILYRNLISSLFNGPQVFDYNTVSEFFSSESDKQLSVYPTLISGWDHTPRSGNRGLVFTNYTPEAFERQAVQVFKTVADKPSEQRIVFLKSWNEWAEGNYMEPDLKYGHAFLNAFKSAMRNPNT